MNNHTIPSMHAEKKLPIFLINTLLLYIPLLALTHRRQNDCRRNEYTCCMWAGGFFFQLCCCFSFLFWWEIGFWFYILTYISTYQIILRTNISLIVVEVLRFLVRQCVVSFHSHFQYGLLPLLTPRS